MLYFIKIFLNLSLGNMLINLDNMLIFFSKRASGMLINDMLIEKKKHVYKVAFSFKPNFPVISWVKHSREPSGESFKDFTRTGSR